jgi:hypothetical protein
LLNIQVHFILKKSFKWHTIRLENHKAFKGI